MDAENRSDQQKNFDHWLDSALQARANAEPRMRLEERVLARLASEPRRKVWWPAIAVAGAAVVLIALAIALLRPTRHEPTLAHGAAEPASAQRVSSPTRTSQASRAAATARLRHGRIWVSRNAVSREQTRERLPKLAAFPTPRPETEQERLLLRLAAQPGLLQTAHLNSDSPLKELSIPAINIPPMEGTPRDNSPLY